MDKTERIRELNDVFRKSFIGGTVLLTQGVDSLNNSNKQVLLARVQAFDEFNRDNDPHREHDFVRVEHDGAIYYGKIDYYANDMQSGSEDPSDPAQTLRVLTIMRADEY